MEGKEIIDVGLPTFFPRKQKGQGKEGPKAKNKKGEEPRSQGWTRMQSILTTHAYVENIMTHIPIYNGAFTLGARDYSVESPNTTLAIEDLNLVIMKFLC